MQDAVEKRAPHLGHQLAKSDVEMASQISVSNLASSSLDLTPIAAHEYTEGGLKANLTVLGAFLALLCTFGQMNAFGTFQTFYAANQLQHLSPSTISWIGSLQLWVFFFSGGPIGHLFDSFGPFGLMLAGSILYVSSIMITSVSTQYYQFMLAQGLLFGLGVGLLFYPAMASVSTHFSRYRATALGIAASGSSVGGVVYPILLNKLFGQVGFGWAVRVSGLISAACCLAAVCLITSLSPTKKDGLESESCQISFRTFTDPAFVLLAAGSCFVALGLFIPYFYIVDYAHSISVSPNLAFYVLAVMNAGGVLGRIAPACLSDAIGRFNLLTPSAFFSGLLCLVFWMFSKSLVPLMIFAACYGFFSGSFISVITPCVAQISDIRQIGTRIGMLYTVISFPALVGGPAAGVLLARSHGSFGGLIALSGSTVIVGSLIILSSKLTIDSRMFARV